MITYKGHEMEKEKPETKSKKCFIQRNLKFLRTLMKINSKKHMLICLMINLKLAIITFITIEMANDATPYIF